MRPTGWSGGPPGDAGVIAIPISLTFFLPFLFSERLGLSFWQAYALGCAALPVGFFVHRAAARLLLA